MAPADASIDWTSTGCPPAQQTAADGGNPPFPRLFFCPRLDPSEVSQAASRIYNGFRSPIAPRTPTRRMQRPWPYPRVVGHRGGGALAPENTLAAIRGAAAMGFGGVEFDVMLSADRVPVLIHDETLERTTDGRGETSATPYAKLASLDAGAWFGTEFRGERVPSFEQA